MPHPLISNREARGPWAQTSGLMIDVIRDLINLLSHCLLVFWTLVPKWPRSPYRENWRGLYIKWADRHGRAGTGNTLVPTPFAVWPLLSLL